MYYLFPFAIIQPLCVLFVVLHIIYMHYHLPPPILRHTYAVNSFYLMIIIAVVVMPYLSIYLFSCHICFPGSCRVRMRETCIYIQTLQLLLLNFSFLILDHSFLVDRCVFFSPRVLILLLKIKKMGYSILPYSFELFP